MSPRFTLRVEAEGALLYDRRSHQYTRPTAAEGFLLAASLEGPLDAALKKLARAVGEKEAKAALRSVKKHGELGADGRFEGRVVELPALDGAYGAPLVAHLGVTLACNFACAHCYSSSGKRAKDELGFDEICAVMDQLRDLGCMKLVLGGGEPFLRKDLAAIVREADARGIDCFVHTNGSKLTVALLHELEACPPAGLALSLDGPTAESNDAIRGLKAFERALVGLEALRRHYAPGFNISVTVTPGNASLAPQMVELAHKAQAKVLLLRPAYPAGEAATSDLACDRDTFARAIDLARPRAKALGVTLDAPHPYEQGVPDFDGFGCVAARVVLGIDPRGRVTPCLNLPEAFYAGSVRDKPLGALWSRGRSFVAVRAQRPNRQCATCKHYEACRGGCRVRALFKGNGLNGPDSWCHYEAKETRA